MKKLLTLTLAALLLLTSLTSCRMPEKQDPFKEILEENPEMELPKSEVMEVAPVDPVDFHFEDVIEDYDNETESDGGDFVCKDKMYEYHGNNITVLKLENHSEANCTVTIQAKFLSTSGIVLKTETQSFEGFPAGWQNYFVFMPQMRYAAMEYTLDVEEYTGEMYFASTSGYVLGDIYEEGMPLREKMAIGDYEKYSGIGAQFDSVGMPKTPYYKRRVAIVFDNTGEIAVINTQHGSFYSAPGEGHFNVVVYTPPIPTKEPLDWPEELDGGVTGIVGILQAELIE